MNIKNLQEEVNTRWAGQAGNPCHLSSPAHTLLHLTKALGKIASAQNDAEHEARPVYREEVSKYLADLVICAARYAAGTVDLQDAVEARLVEKFPTR